MATLLFSLATLFFTFAQGLHTPKYCDVSDLGSTLRVINVNSPCSPFRPKTPLSWEDSVLKMQSSDKARFQYLSSLLVAGGGRRSIVPIASGRAITQNPTYIVRAKIGTPAQTLLMAVDTSNDAAWIPCTGCVGCSATTFDPSMSTTFKPVSCGAPQCNQVLFNYIFCDVLDVCHALTRHRWAVKTVFFFSLCCVCVVFIQLFSAPMLVYF